MSNTSPTDITSTMITSPNPMSTHSEGTEEEQTPGTEAAVGSKIHDVGMGSNLI